jgi:Fe-S-cluster-containing dehydrogenase component
MPRWGMVIDLDKCFACQSCTVACRMENNTPVAGPDQTARGRTILWNEVLPFVEGEYPQATVTLIPRPCQQCDNPPCVKVCPVQATYKNEEGIVLVDWTRCIGCRFCTVACPYQVRYFNWYEPEWPEALKAHLNPDPEVAPRPRGVVEKCTFCIQRLRKAREKAQRHRLHTGLRANLYRPCALLWGSGRPCQPGIAIGGQPSRLSAIGGVGDSAQSLLPEARIAADAANG